MRWLLLLAVLLIGCDQPVASRPAEPAILAFHADWCSVCQKQKPVWRALGYPVYYVDVDRFPNEASRYGVTVLPTTICFLSGVEVGREVGYAPAEKIERHLRH